MILKRLIQNKFDTNHHITVGVEFSSYNLEIDSETSVKLQIWDTVHTIYVILRLNCDRLDKSLFTR